MIAYRYIEVRGMQQIELIQIIQVKSPASCDLLKSSVDHHAGMFLAMLP